MCTQNMARLSWCCDSCPELLCALHPAALHGAAAFASLCNACPTAWVIWPPCAVGDSLWGVGISLSSEPVTKFGNAAREHEKAYRLYHSLAAL